MFHGHLIRMFILLWFHGGLYGCLLDSVVDYDVQLWISLIILSTVTYQLLRLGCGNLHL